MRLLNLRDGEAVWSQETKIPGPSGHGLLVGNAYHLPLVTNALAEIDLATGKLTTTQLEGESPLGNLVWQDGHLISQRADSVQLHTAAAAN